MKFILVFTAALAFLACLSTVGKMPCSTGASCEKNEVESSCSATSACGDFCLPFSEKNDCGNDAPASPTSGGTCCVCGPGCCVFEVPEYRFELRPAPPGKVVKRVFADPGFCPQAVCQSIWHPPAGLV